MKKGKFYKLSLVVVLCLALFASTILTFVSLPERVEASSKKDFVIVIDPGHDDTHDRSRLTTSGIHEPTRNLEVAKSLKTQLEAYGFTVYMTRSTSACPAPAGTKEQTDCLQYRANIAKSKGADLLISIHHNAATSDKDHWYNASGSVIFISTRYEGTLSNLASKISANLKSYCGLPESTPKGYAKHCTTGATYPNGTAADYWDILYYSAINCIPALIVEHGFMDNKYDSSKINSISAYTFAKADCDAIVAWYNEKYGSGTSGSSSAGTAAYVNSKEVNLRSSASTSASVVTRLSAKDTITLYTKSNGWYKATAYHNGSTYTGYIYCDYVTTGTPSSVNSGVSGYCNVSSLNVRSQSSTSSSSVVQIVKGDSLMLYEQTNGFYRCTAYHNGKSYNGYVASSYVAKGSYKSSSSSTTTTSSSSAGISYIITGEGVNLRSSNSTTSSILTTLSKNDKATLISLTGDWAKLTVTHNGKSYTGYVAVKYITKATSSSTNKIGSVYVVTANAVNLRSSTTTNSSVLTVLKKYEQGTLVSLTGDWAKLNVTHDGKSYTGYVMVKYITKSADQSGAVSSTTSSSSSSSSTTASTSSSGSNSFKVNATALNLRSSASMSASVVTVLSKDDKVTILSSSSDWARVAAVHKGTTYKGYVMLTYLTRTGSTSGSSSGSSTASSSKSGTIKGNGVNVRSSASLSGSKVTTLNTGASVTILGTSGNWYKVSCTKDSKTYTGYVNADYVTVK